MAKVETVINAVKMDDGRTVDFAGKRKMLKESIFDEKTGDISIRLDFVNGETRLFKLPSSLLAKFAAHGAEQKLGDEIAGLSDVEDAIIAIDELTTRLEAGKWGQTRESNGLAGASTLAKALAEHSGKDLATIKAYLAGKTQAEKVALRNNPSVQPIVLRIETEKAAKSKASGKEKAVIDTDALLGELA